MMSSGEIKTESAATMSSELLKQKTEFDMLEASISDEAMESIQTMPEQQEPPQTAEILQPVLEMGFAVLAPNWGVTQSEIKQLSECYGQLVDKYFPDGVGDYGLEINAILITGAIVLPRLRTPRKLEAVNDGGEDGEKA